MRLAVIFYRAGSILALIAIYDAVGGPMVGDGGLPMATAMGLMAVGLFYRIINDELAKRRRRSAAEVSS